MKAKIDAAKLAKQLKLSKNTVLNKVNSEDFDEWLADRRWIVRLNLAKTCKIYKCPQGYRCAAFFVAAATGLSPTAVSRRLIAWSKGNIDCDILFRPSRLSKKIIKKSETDPWEGLSNESRAHLIYRIPSPTANDRRYSR